MSSDDPYFQFPISAIRLGKSIADVTTDERFEHVDRIIDYAIQTYADKAYEYDRGEVEKVANRYAEEQEFSLKTIPYWMQRVLYAASKLGVTYVRPPHGTHLQQTKLAIDARKGGRRMVRIRQDILFDVRESDGWTWREFAVLCGIIAGVGDRPKHQLSFEFIQTLAYGCSNEAELSQHIDAELLLTRRQVRSTIENLDRRKIYARASPDGRRMYYSHRMDAAELLESLIDEQVAKAGKKLGQSDATVRIQEAAKKRIKPPNARASK